MKPLITSKTDWSQDLIHQVWEHIADIADNDMRVTYYQPQIEVISSEQMIDAYASIGLPVGYPHWSFGKQFVQDMKDYQEGRMGLAYEIVINSDPCISYLMEENNMVTQALVIAHAAVGHSAVFKNNYMFKDWTSAGSIVDYMVFAKKYIRECEETFGIDAVEKVLDAAHALSAHGVDKRKRKHTKVMTEEDRMKEVLEKFQDEQKHLDLVMKKTKIEYPKKESDPEKDEAFADNEENLLYFIYKNAPNMENWKREILRIVYKINQYFYPQSQTKVLNEGFATFTHYYIMNELEKRGILSSDAQIEWLQLHSGVLYQHDMTTQFNPYALGFAIFKDIKRICEEPTDEDKEWFPQLIGKDWRDAVQDAAFNYRDESFIQQFLSPHLIRKWRLFSVVVSENRDVGIVEDISDARGYQKVRETLALQHNRVNYVPDISVYSAAMKQNRELTLEYKPYNNRKLYTNYAAKVMTFIRELWGYPVQMIQFEGTNMASEDEGKLLFYRK